MELNAEKLAEIVEDSAMIAQAAIRLASNRCLDLNIVPIMSFMFLVRISEKNIKELDKQILKAMPVDLSEVFKNYAPLMEKRFGRKIKTELDMQQAFVDIWMEKTTFKKEYFKDY